MADVSAQTTPPLVGRYWLLAALTLVLAPHLWRLPPGLAVGALIVLSWRLLREQRSWPLPARWLRIGLTLLGIGAVVLLFRTIIGREAGTALLSVLICLKLLELRSLRDALLLIFLGYFLVVVGFLFDTSIFTGLYMFAVVLTLTAAAVALNHPAADRQHTGRYLRQSALLLLQALPLMVLLFILFPRINAPLWHMPEEKERGRTGLSEEMRMGEITDLADSDELVFRVEFPGPLPAADQLYWRGPVMWRTDGMRWQRLAPGEFGKMAHNALDFERLGPVIDYVVTLEPQSRNWLFALDLPTQLPAIDGNALLLPDYQLLSAKSFTERIRYAMRSVSSYRTGAIGEAELRFALQLPPAANPRSRGLAQGWRAAGLDDAAIVARALDHFRNQPFYYTRQPPALGADAVDDFLFDTRRGFCEHYAAAFVTLMRAAGVPARVVTGYQGGDYNSVGRFLEVRQNRAHAWAEVWLAGQGWVRVDPTAQVPSERVVDTLDSERFTSTAPATRGAADYPLLRATLLQLRQGWGAVNYAWSVWVIGFDEERQRALLKKMGLERLDWGGLIALMGGAVAAVLGVVALLLFWRRPRGGDPALLLYRRFRKRLARAGVVSLASEAPQRLAQRAGAALPGHAAIIDEITACYVALRYGNADPQALHQLRGAVERFRP